MCGRRTLFHSIEDIIQEYHISQWDKPENFRPSYNIFPETSSPIVYFDGNQIIAREMIWGLHTNFSPLLINARSETLSEKPTFRSLRPCIVPSNGYYEWKSNPSKTFRQPFYIFQREHGLLSMAGLFDNSSNRYIIVTTVPTKSIAFIHDRMPSIFSSQSEADAWLRQDISPEAFTDILIQPYENLSHYPVSTFVNIAKNNSPECCKSLNVFQF